MKAFLYWWTREDILFASAVLPAALVWIQLESAMAGLFAWTLCYAAIVGLYEFTASRRGWSHAAAVEFLKEIAKFYNPR